MKIAVLGSAPSSCRLAPFSDPEFQIWGCSPALYPIVPRVDAWFELHRWEPPVIGKPDQQKPWFSPEYCAWMAQQKLVWMQNPVPEIPNSKALDYKDLTQRYGSYFFTSSLAWMMAVAIDAIQDDRQHRHDHGIDNVQDVIALYGVDMAANEEYCVAPETKVLTADLRWVPASELQEGDQIISFDEETGGKSGNCREWKLATVESTKRLKRPCKRLVMEDGSILVSSDEHRWLTYAEHENRWKETKQMVTSSHREGRPTRIVKLTNTWTEDKSWEAGYLAAAFDGEGNLLQKHRDECDGVQLGLGFAQRENGMSKAVLLAAESKGFRLTKTGVSGKNGDCIKYRLSGTRSDVLEFLGRIRPRRLLDKFNPEMLGKMQRKDAVAVLSMEDIGEQEVIALKTSTGTFVAEGFASHNSDQRPGCQFFIQLAIAAGIQVIVPPESDLMAPPMLYGIGESDHMMIKLTERRRELDQRLHVIRTNLETLKRDEMFISGALDDLNYVMKTWVNAEPAFGANFRKIMEQPKVKPEHIGNVTFVSDEYREKIRSTQTDRAVTGE